MELTRKRFLKAIGMGSAGLALPMGILNGRVDQANAGPRPNILWIVSEDNSPLLGCYGDDFATTPNRDKLAGESIVYDTAYANTPVCAPARFTILTGMYASVLGTENMRSRNPIPDYVKPYPYFLRDAGYHCTNPGKTAGHSLSRQVWTSTASASS